MLSPPVLLVFQSCSVPIVCSYCMLLLASDELFS